MSAGREGFDSNSSPVWGTPTANQELCCRSCSPALFPAAKEMSIRGMAEQESGREKCQSRNSWPSPQCKGDAATSLGQGSVRTVEKGNETLSVSSGELPAETLGRKGHRQRVLRPQRWASQKDSFGTVRALWLPDPPGQVHGLSQEQGSGPWRAGQGGEGTPYKSPSACWQCSGLPGVARWTL